MEKPDHFNENDDKFLGANNLRELKDSIDYLNTKENKTSEEEKLQGYGQDMYNSILLNTVETLEKKVETLEKKGPSVKIGPALNNIVQIIGNKFRNLV